jgi:replicative DNA helicase
VASAGAPATAPTAAGFEAANERTYSVESERLLLSTCLKSDRRALLGQLLGLVSRDDFSIEQHSHMWHSVASLNEAGSAHDITALLDYTRKASIFIGGLEYVAGLMDDPLALTASDEAILDAAKRVKNYATLRRLRDLMRQGGIMCEQGTHDVDTIISYVEDELMNLRKLGESSRSGPVHLRDTLMVAMDHMQNQMDGKVVPAVTTGYENLDGLITGFADEDLIILAGRPSMGKTAMLTNLGRNGAVLQAQTALVFELEVKGRALGLRMLAREARVNLGDLRGAKVRDGDWERITDALETLSSAPVWIDDTPGLTMHEIRSRARTFVAQHGKCTIYIDYLQFVAARPGVDTKNHVSEVSRGLKGLARELKCPVVALAQLNRALEARANKRPIMSDLRESGNIEQDADLIMFIYRDEVYNPDTREPGIAEVIVAKQRDGAIGTVRLGFAGPTNHFFEPGEV